MAASLLSGSAGDEPTASVVVGAGLAIVRPVMSWKGRFNSKILLKLAKSIAQMANCPRNIFIDKILKMRLRPALTIHVTIPTAGNTAHRGHCRCAPRSAPRSTAGLTPNAGAH